MKIIYDEYSEEQMMDFINNYEIYNSSKKMDFKPKDIGILDFRKPSVISYETRVKYENLREYKG